MSPADDLQGWSRSLALDVSLSRGNTTDTQIGGSARLQWQSLFPPAAAGAGPGSAVAWMRTRAFVVASRRLSQNAGAVYASEGFLHARWTRMWVPRFGTEAFTQYQFDAFQRLHRRTLVGYGVRVELVHTRRGRLAAGSSFMHQQERLERPASPTDEAPSYWEQRWSNYVSARIAARDGGWAAGTTAYVQPRIGAAGDYRLLDESQVSVRLTGALALTVAVSVAHDSRPPAGVKPTDVRMFDSVRLTF